MRIGIDYYITGHPLVAVIYRPNTYHTLTPTVQLDHFLQTFENILSELDKNKKSCCQLTDSNIDLLKYDMHSSQGHQKGGVGVRGCQGVTPPFFELQTPDIAWKFV